jgi:hypothetical protein
VCDAFGVSTPRVSDCITTREIADATLEQFTMHCSHALTCYELTIEVIERAIAIVDAEEDKKKVPEEGNVVVVVVESESVFC